MSSPVLWIALALPVFVLLWTIGTMNRLTRLHNLVKESWSQVDVALKRRYDLIPNLVETCKAFASHERETFERVIEARNRAMSNHGSAADQARDESALVGSVRGLLARAESNPQLRSSEHFLELQRELANTEDRIAAARRFYNSNVRDYNVAIEQFPASLVAGERKPVEFFEADSLEVRMPAGVAF